MNPILQAAGMMGQAKIVRRATAKTVGRTVFLWQLSDGRTLELVREGQFKSVVERTETFDSLLEFYQRGHCKVFSPNLAVA